jgi:hypothetical protein
MNDLSIAEYTSDLVQSDYSKFSRNILEQLLIFFTETLKYNFTHNNVNLGNIQFEQVEYLKYNPLGKSGIQNGERKVTADFTLKFSDFRYSCISYGNNRLLNFNTFSELFVKDEPIIEDIETKIVSLEKMGMYSMYKFNHETSKKILHLSRLGVVL